MGCCEELIRDVCKVSMFSVVDVIFIVNSYIVDEGCLENFFF